jgi:oxaloacetate decarboxylase alpha subunit
MESIKFVDTTIRDGHQSLWAENMTTGMMLPVADAMDRAGFDAIELISSSHLKKCVRELKEDPWALQRLRSHAAVDVPAFYGTYGCQRHPRSAHLRRVERA